MIENILEEPAWAAVQKSVARHASGPIASAAELLAHADRAGAPRHARRARGATSPPKSHSGLQLGVSSYTKDLDTADCRQGRNAEPKFSTLWVRGGARAQ